MVKVKEGTLFAQDGNINLEEWLEHVVNKGYFQDIDLIRNACALAELAGHDKPTETPESCLQQGLAMADVLIDLEIDEETVAAAIVFESVHYAELLLDDVGLQLGEHVAKLVGGVERMSLISNIEIGDKYTQNKHQVDNMRKMLLAMVDDVRVVLIKLAERLCVLRSSASMPDKIRRQIALEAQTIYAPLANRLGVGAIKWEMEDYAFRYLEPEKYKNIAKGLKARRIERDKYVNFIVDELNKQLTALNFQHFAVYGRSKHIHSIYNKMRRKGVSLEEIYDATAVRILVETEPQCYEVLSLVHSLWHQITEEFDDYIANRKPNGYQSLHTAVIGPDKRVFEVQVRTFQMHEQAEMGVAAHWKYKEGVSPRKESHERKIEWLREVLSWHKEIASQKGINDALEKEFLEERVYVFTPDGDILDLPQQATALDFAYHVHTEVGHRCRGAKVNGKMVPLTYQLKTGDRVEVLTGKQSKPSLDWISPHHNFLKSSRAKAKVLHWFKMQDYDKNLADGRDVLNHELKVLGVKADKLHQVATSFNFHNTDDMFAALGRGDLKAGQILHRITPDEPKAPSGGRFVKKQVKPNASGSNIQIEGVGNLLSTFARCCQPLPGDDVIGYITVGRGVSVHRKDCTNILHANERQRDRFLEVTWGDKSGAQYLVDVVIKAYDRAGLLRDITFLLANEKAHVFALETKTDKNENLCYTTLTIEINNLVSLSRILAKISQIPNVLEARRQV